jgi:2'-5' RNA ligase
VRLFVAILPPPEALAELGAALGPVRDGPDGAPVPGVRWVPPEQWHVTLAFLGEIGTDVVEALTLRLARVAAHHPPPTLALAGGGRFSDRVLWTGVTERSADLRAAGGAGGSAPGPGGVAGAGRPAGTAGSAPGPGSRGGPDARAGDRGGIRALAASVRAAARRCGIAGQEPDRRYRPHLTLARGRPGADLAPLAARLAGFSGAPWQARALHLVRSDLNAGPGGTARHTVRGTWLLTGRQRATGSNRSRPS